MLNYLPAQALNQLDHSDGNLQEVQEELLFNARALYVAGAGAWEIYRDSEDIFLSNQWHVLYSKRTPIARLKDYASLFELEARKEFLDLIKKVFDSGKQARLEFYHTMLDGRIVLSRGRVIEPGRMVGADILL